MAHELRSLPGSVELREQDGRPQLIGTAIKWDSLSEDLGGWREKFAPNSVVFDDATRVMWQHDGKYVFGRIGAGTAGVTVDERGLHYRADPPDAHWARDAMESVKRGDVHQNSFRFSIVEPREQNEEWTVGEDGKTMIRTVKRAHIFEMGPQTDPAYPDTNAAVRAMQEARARLVTPPPEWTEEERAKWMDRLGPPPSLDPAA